MIGRDPFPVIDPFRSPPSARTLARPEETPAMAALCRMLPVLLLLSMALTACSEPTQEELLQAATEAYEQKRFEVEEATSELALREEELAMAQAARDEAAERVRRGERELAEARAQVGLHATDELLFREVQQALLEDETLADVAVSARVDDGVVTLQGHVPDESIRERAIAVASNVPGIAEVNSQLTIPAPPEAADDEE